MTRWGPIEMQNAELRDRLAEKDAEIDRLREENARLRRLDVEYGRVEGAIIMRDRHFDGDSDHPNCGERLIASVNRIADENDRLREQVRQAQERLAAYRADFQRIQARSGE